MSNTTTSPNMSMPVPVVGTDPGPDWANNIDACLSIIDSHDHSFGKGAPITIPSTLTNITFAGTVSGVVTSATYSPTVLWTTSTPTINAQTWYYTRVGAVVHVMGYINVTSGGSNSSLASVSLPVSTAALVAVGSGQVSVTSGTATVANLRASGTTIVVPVSALTTGSGSLVGDYQLSFTYLVS